jgi:biofilm protein TabA
MITGDLASWRARAELLEFAEVFRFLETADLLGLPPGPTPIDGERIFAMASSSATHAPELGVFEAHRRHIDVHLVVTGQETIDFASGPLRTTKEYEPTSDVELFAAPPEPMPVALRAGSFAVFFTGEAHRPGGHLDGPHQVSKVVVKVRAG